MILMMFATHSSIWVDLLILKLFMIFYAILEGFMDLNKVNRMFIDHFDEAIEYKSVKKEVERCF